MTQVAVTGGSGFVAGWCIAQLLDAGHEVVATIRSPEREAGVRAAAGATPGSRLSFGVADLSGDDGWDDALAGCEVVLHVASPMSSDEVDAKTMIAEAVDGTRRVLAAADRAGARRVVMTSSCAAATPLGSQLSGTVDESCWTDPDEPGLSAYRRSKTVAERAAWDFTAATERSFSLTTILPAAVFGPARSPSALGPLGLIRALLDGSAMAIPRLGFEIVDVRDVAAAHLLAMADPSAEGERFIVSGELLWFADVADVLRGHLGDDAAAVPTATLTDDEFRSVAEVSPQLAGLLPLLGRDLVHPSDKARRVLGWRSRPARDTVVDSARSLLGTTA